MPLNKNSNFIKLHSEEPTHPVDTLTKVKFELEDENTKKNKAKPKRNLKLKNFLIEKNLIEEFELLCKLQDISFTDSIINFIKSEVEQNKEPIAALKKVIKI